MGRPYTFEDGTHAVFDDDMTDADIEALGNGTLENRPESEHDDIVAAAIARRDAENTDDTEGDTAPDGVPMGG